MYYQVSKPRVELLVKLITGLIFGGILIIAVILKFSYSDIGYDTGLYHLQKIQWLVEYGHVPGLANLDGRLGFYSIYFYIGALLIWLFDSPNASLYLNLLIIVLFISWLTVRIVQAKTIKWLILYLVSLLGILYYQELFKSIYQDIGTYVIGIVSFLYFLEKLDVNKKISSAWILIIVAVLISIKFSMLFLSIMVLFYIKPLKHELNTRQHAWVGLCVVLLIALMIWHNYWISGWLLYPSPFIDIFNPDWKVPEYLVLNQMTVTSTFAKSSGNLFHLAEIKNMGFFEWIQIWWVEHDKMHWFLYLCGLSAVYLFIRTWAIYKELSKHYLYVLITIFIGVVGWFLTAPSLRFGFVWLMGVLLLALYVLLRKIERQYFIEVVRPATLILILLIFIKQMGLGAAVSEDYPELNVDLTTNIPTTNFKSYFLKNDSSEVFYLPVEGERSYWANKLPVCSRMLTDSLMPFINDVPRYRADKIEKGFYTDPNISIRNISKDSLNTFYYIRE